MNKVRIDFILRKTLAFNKYLEWENGESAISAILRYLQQRPDIISEPYYANPCAKDITVVKFDPKDILVEDPKNDPWIKRLNAPTPPIKPWFPPIVPSLRDPFEENTTTQKIDKKENTKPYKKQKVKAIAKTTKKHDPFTW